MMLSQVLSIHLFIAGWLVCGGGHLELRFYAIRDISASVRFVEIKYLRLFQFTAVDRHLVLLSTYVL